MNNSVAQIEDIMELLKDSFKPNMESKAMNIHLKIEDGADYYIQSVGNKNHIGSTPALDADLKSINCQRTVIEMTPKILAELILGNKNLDFVRRHKIKVRGPASQLITLPDSFDVKF